MKKEQNQLVPLEGKQYNALGRHAKTRGGVSMVELLGIYAGCSIEEVKQRGTEYDYKMVERGRMVRSRLATAASNPKDLAKVRRELVDELMSDGKMTHQNALYIIRQILSAMAEAEVLDRKTHRMILDRRNQRAWEIAEEQKDVAAMNAADKNYISIHQLEQEDTEKLDADKIQVQNLMVTVNYNEIVPDSSSSDNPWDAIKEARKLATSGVISLKDEKDAKKYVTTDIDDFDDFVEADEQIGEKPL